MASCETPLELSESDDSNCPDDGRGTAELLLVDDMDDDMVLLDDDSIEPDA